MNTMRIFTISTLAEAYFPDRNPVNAQRGFKRMLERNTELHEKLVKAGLKPRQRVLTPIQYDLVVEYLGEP